MIIMALDHVRDFIHINSVTESPTNLSTTTAILFFTRWITYLCAPIFVFLAGTSAYLSFRKKADSTQSRKFLFKRGLWLMLVEFTIMNFGLYFDAGFHSLIFEVIAAIGFGFIILSLLLKVSLNKIAVAGLAILFCHDLLPLIPFGPGSIVKTILSPLFSPGVFQVFPNRVFDMAYPPIPWLGIMLVGFASGKLFELPRANRQRLFIRIGLASLLFFVVLRFINIYGDPSLWSAQKNAMYTFLSFMNVTKYPPSLLFCSVTLGTMFLLLAISENLKNRVTDIVSVYGKVPLAYFIVHFYIIHSLLIIILFLQGFHWADLRFASGNLGRPVGAESGLQLWAVYLIWIAVVVLLYKPCIWYGKYKADHNHWWLKYI